MSKSTFIRSTRPREEEKGGVKGALQLVLDLNLLGGLSLGLVALRPAQRRTRRLELVLALLGLRDAEDFVLLATAEFDVDATERAVPALGAIAVPLLGVILERALLGALGPALKIAETVGAGVLVALLRRAAKEAQLVRVVSRHGRDARPVQLLPLPVGTVLAVRQLVERLLG